ncbi:outer membrane protein [Acidimangrovimonas pyrenivorans]|uniref:Outer membrane protein n=1 Tax=Acidimangrovimonas pyrenivorans TaxID=2030798 RepID=A0ABV7AIL6_9RHOB
MKTFAALAAASLMAAPAFAGGMAEPVQKPAPVAPAPVAMPAGHDWTGGYVGAQLGYSNVNGTGGNGAIGGVHAGYLYDFGNWVAGGELAYDTSNITLGGGGKLDHVARLAVKAGPDLGNVFLYGTLGVASAKATVGGASHTDNGYFAGLGADYALNNQWTLGGEVLAHRFKNFGGTGTDLKPVTAEVKVSYHF